MSLSVGIVGLPNVGKSTLFNALLKRQQALAANYTFATIEPNVGVVPVPDERLNTLAKIVSEAEMNGKGLPPIVSATVNFVDIAGLAPGAHKGEGLGNKFLSHIREVNVILHVVRNFNDENIIRAGSTTPQDDIAVINTELILKDLETVEKMIEARGRSTDNIKEGEALLEIKKVMDSGKLLYQENISETALELAKNVSLLTIKPQIIVFNADELNVALRDLRLLHAVELDPSNGSSNMSSLQNPQNPSAAIAISAKLESELSALSEEEQKEYLKQLGIEESGLDKVIKACYDLLGYSTFLTAGQKEVRAWQFKKGLKAPQCAGITHTDFEKAFIAVDVVVFEDFVKYGGWRGSKESGKARLEGRDYIMQDGDVVLFRVNTR